MKRKYFILLTALMSLSILGITTIQVIWIRNSIEVQNEIFDRTVHEALTIASKRLDTRQKLNFTKRLMVKDSVHRADRKRMKDLFVYAQRKHNISTLLNRAIDRDTPRQRLETVFESKTKDSVYTIYLPEPEIPTNINIGISEVNKIKVGYSTEEKIDIDPNDLEQFQSIIDRKYNMMENFVSEIVHEFNSVETGSDISQELIEAVLKEELYRKGIDTKFEYKIVNNSRLIDSHSKVDKLTNVYITSLYPNSIFHRDIGLTLTFPHKKGYILNSIIGMLILSLLFSAIILITFGLSLYTIINQKRLSQMQTDFVNNMTHEFKTPIATISVASDSIASPIVASSPEKIKFFTDMIKKELVRMNSHVERILKIARFEKAGTSMNLDTVDAHESIEKVLESISLQIERRGGVIIFKPEATNPNITTDSSHFQSIVNNIIDNANKYSEESPEITITTKNVKRGLEITVEDRGIGMTKAVQSKIFDRFYRQTSGNIHNVIGFGLGLSYVKEIVSANKGEIKVQSEIGKGSKFTLFLPYTIE